MNNILNFVREEPFTLLQKQKDKIFLKLISDAVRFHYLNSKEFKNLCDNNELNINSEFKLSDVPYLPVSIFKKFDLISVPKKEIIKILYSSSTSGQPSKILIDLPTSEAQIFALNNIMGNFFGTTRKVLIVFDTPKIIESKDGELSSRGTAIRGMFSIAKRVEFILNDRLEFDEKKFRTVLKNLRENEEICFFGFTWLLYTLCSGSRNNNIKKTLSKVKNKDKITLHIGGWKKLKDKAVNKTKFNELISEILNVNPQKVIDFYGMTEQLGTIYPDCEYGYKHVPLYSEIIIRNIDTLKSAENGSVGLLQFLSPIPHSYPGISILSDDLGKIIGVDDCKCGRKGKYFLFEKRSETAEVKGCGDTLNIENE